MRSVPSMPSGQPGKFSTILVVVSNPPGMAPVSTTGLSWARAVYKAAVSPAQPEPMMTTFSISFDMGGYATQPHCRWQVEAS